MKPLTILLFLFVSFNSMGQIQNQNDTTLSKINLHLEKTELRLLKGGNSLKVASASMMAGYFFSLGGVALMAAGITYRPLLIVGIGVSIVGVSLSLNGIGKIGVAGRQLNGTLD